MGSILTSLLAWFAVAISRVGTWMSLHYMATKFILGVCFILVLPVILNNVLLSVAAEIFYWWLGQTPFGQGLPGELNQMPKAFSFIGVGGYIFMKMGLGEALIIVLNASAYRMAMSWIPFVGPK